MRKSALVSRKGWLIAGLAVAASLFTSEIALRHLFGLGDPITVSTDKDCEYILSPNQHKLRFGKHVDINRFGMRSEPVAPTKTIGQLRILLVGDSVLYGTSRVGQDQIFAGLLERELPAKLHRPVEILNASASAWGISNEKDYIRSRGIFASDLVILVLNTGDLSQPRAGVGGVGGELPTKKYACAWCELWARLFKPKIFHQSAREDAGITVENNATQVERNLNSLDEFQSIVGGAGHTRMRIVFIAFRRDVHHAAQQSAPPQLIDWARKVGVPLMDLTRFETRFSTKDFTLDGVHLSVFGNRIIATAIENNWYQLDFSGI